MTKSPHIITDPADIRRIGGETMQAAIEKVFRQLDEWSRKFIELSPFICLASSNGRGGTDVSPRGDGPGFVQVLDDRTVLIPDRPGNRRHDTMVNLLSEPSVGLIFFVPGINETLRVNGTATVTDDAELLARCEYRKHVPVLGILVTVEEVFFHCAKALLRSGLWTKEAQSGRDDFPRIGNVIKAQMKLKEDVADIEKAIQESYKRDLYSTSDD